MTACARIGFGSGSCSFCRGGSDSRKANAPSPSVVSLSGRWNCCRSAVGRISMSMTDKAPFVPVKLERKMVGGGEKRGNGGAVVSRETLDDWLRDSVVEIVKNLSEAPLMVHLYAGSNGMVKTRAEKAEDWSTVKDRWEKDGSEMPESVIFVEKLEDDVSDQDSVDDRHGGSGISEGSCRAWGIVAQGRGVESGPVCYLLKTSRVGSGVGSGSGVFCTHFCLVKVKSFRETTKSQLKNCWLQQNGQGM